MQSDARLWLATLVLIGCAGCTSTEPDSPGSGTSGAASSSSTGAGGGGSDAGVDGDAGEREGLAALFIGNSYTYVNDLPARVRELAETAGVPPSVSVAQVTVGSATFATHWNGAEAQPAIADGDSTYVVLQGQSTEPIASPAAFHEYGALLAEAAIAAGAKPVFYETWARKAGDAIYADPFFGGSPDAMQDGLSAAYEELAKDTGASIAPVGEAWRIAWTRHPEIELYQADGSHPSPSGTYLAACVFYIVLAGHPLAEASAVPADVDPGEAAALRAIATQAASAE